MSTIYNLEPPTKGKVILKTSLGNIDIELWPKEAPVAVRNFVQLCLEGYYDGTIFHRMIKDFMVQGGDPSGTGEGGESIYGGPFKDEFHSRLRFSHRGLVACANQNEKDTNGSQFFMTLDATSWLDKNNTIFGRVAGDTIYNLLKFNDLEVDDDDRPAEPPVLEEVEVVWNPFEDIKPRITAEQRKAVEEAKKIEANKKPKREGKRKLALLSFGEEAEQEEQELLNLAASVPTKIRSAHEVLEDDRLEKAEPSDAQPAGPSAELLRVRDKLADRKAAGAAEKEAKKVKRDTVPEAVPVKREAPDKEPDFASRMRSQIDARRDAMGDVRKPRSMKDVKSEADHEAGEDNDKHRDRARSRSAERERRRSPSSGGDTEHDNDSGGDDGPQAEVARRRAELEDKKHESRKRTLGRVVTETQVENADLLKPYQIMREQYKQRKRVIGHREKETLDRLNKFKEQLKAKKAEEIQKASSQADGAEADTAKDKDADNIGQDKDKNGQDKDKNGRDKDASKKDDKGYSGRVDKDLDHRKYMPAAWRVDDYLNDQEDDDEQGIEGLRGHVLKFNKEEKKDHMSRRDDVDDYVVHDPLLEKGKGKFSKMAQKEKKRNTEWARRSVT